MDPKAKLVPNKNKAKANEIYYFSNTNWFLIIPSFSLLA
jgi:hypothetical protein